MIERVLEPEAMDSDEEAREYDAMDHTQVNARFVADFLKIHGPCRGGQILDVGTGTAQIPIELCRVDPNARVLAIDLAPAMLAVARENTLAANFDDRISLDLTDAKHLNTPDTPLEALISNSIIHHIADPAAVLAQMVQLAEQGTLFVRDLCRPDYEAELGRLVTLHAAGESPKARALFADSLHAALTVDEVRQCIPPKSRHRIQVEKTSDRHWTLWSSKPSA